MMYPILVEPERILSWEEFDRKRGYNFEKMREKAQQGEFCSAPPIIVSPMPQEYRGRYHHFLFNGHSRLMIAREFELPLLGLVVERDEEIPPCEWTGDVGVGYIRIPETDTLGSRINGILSQKIQPHPTISYDTRETLDLSYLVQEFMKWEQGKQRDYE